MGGPNMSETFDIEDVQRLNVKPGDVLLVTVAPGTSPETAERIRNMFETTLPVRALVKTADIDVEVAGPERVR
jgi:hypothetical protein